MTEKSKREVSWVNSLELFIVSDFMRSCHSESSMRRKLAFMFNGMNSVGKSVLLQIVLGLDFYHLFFIRVHILGLFWFFLFSLGLAVYENILRVSCEGKGVELVCVVFVELIRSR